MMPITVSNSTRVKPARTGEILSLTGCMKERRGGVPTVGGIYVSKKLHEYLFQTDGENLDTNVSRSAQGVPFTAIRPLDNCIHHRAGPASAYRSGNGKMFRQLPRRQKSPVPAWYDSINPPIAPITPAVHGQEYRCGRPCVPNHQARECSTGRCNRRFGSWPPRFDPRDRGG